MNNSEGLTIKRGNNRHSFTMSSHGYRLVVEENAERVPRNYPYCCKFGTVSFDEYGDYAGFGIGKREKNEATSFCDGMERQMMSLQEEKESTLQEIERLKQKVMAIDDFLNALPAIFIADGFDDKPQERHDKIQRSRK